MQLHHLPAHPTAVYPDWHSLAGQAVRALHVDRHGHARYPVMGGAPDPDPDPDPAPDPDPSPDPDPAPKNDKGFPDNTRWQDMTDTEQAAYWRHNAQKHEGRYKNLVGDRSYDDVQKDLTEYAEFKKSQLTPAEQQLTERYEQGKQDATSEANTKAAKAIFRANLKSIGLEDGDVEELVDTIDVTKFVVDGDIDTAKIAGLAGKFTPADKASRDKDRRRPDFGGGRRDQGDRPRGTGGKTEAARRFGKKSTDD